MDTTRHIMGIGRQIMARGGMEEPPCFPHIPDFVRNNPEQLQSWYVEIAQDPYKYIPENIRKKRTGYVKKLADEFKAYASLKAAREWTGRKKEAEQMDNAADNIEIIAQKMEPIVKTVNTAAGMLTFEAHKNLVMVGEYIYEGQLAKAIFETLKAGGKIVGASFLLAGGGGISQAVRQPIVMIGSKVFRVFGGGKSKVIKYIGEIGKQFEKVVEKGKTLLRSKATKSSKAKEIWGGGHARESWQKEFQRLTRTSESVENPICRRIDVMDPGGVGPRAPSEPGQIIDIIW